MDTKILLIKIITLIYRSRLVGNIENDDLIRTIINTIKVDLPEFNFNGHNLLKSLKDFITQLLEEKETIVKEVLLQHLSLILENEPKLLATVKESIEPDYDDATNKRIITSLVKTLTNQYKEHLAISALSIATHELKFNRSKITNFSDYLKNLLTNLEPLTSMTTSIKDPALVGEVDFENPDSIISVFEEVKNSNASGGIYKLGWQALNKMLQGGLRRNVDNLVTVGALQHKYKTGFTLSLFMQIAQFNSPIVIKGEEGKKPLLLRISLEDSLMNNLQFMYQYLKASESEFIKPSDLDKIDAKEMTKYVTEKMTATGFHIKMLRVNPSEWTYSSVLNKIIELEAQSYQVHVLIIDYALLLSTTGCTTGPLGTEKRDLLRRLRNFCAARNIIFITPLQLSSEAMNLIRTGIPNEEFLSHISQKSYYDGSKTISQELDLELYIHLFSHKKNKYLAVHRGKHRIPTIISDDDMQFFLKFIGPNIPILPDIDREDSSYIKLPKGNNDSSASNLLDEVLN
jgi:hypothetical protein